VAAYYRRLISSDPTVRLQAARAWSVWEASTSKLVQDQGLMGHFSEDEFAVAFARIECHYFMNRGFFDQDGQLLRQVDRIRHIPGVIVQGRYDVVCPATTAWELHRAWPEARFVMVQEAGHSATEPGISSALVAATDEFLQYDG
jgi:proline iminopeptidase